MSKARLFSFLSVAALSLGLRIPAVATSVSITSGMTSTQPGAVNSDFESGVPSGFAFSGTSGIVNTALPFNYAIPSADASHYAYVGVGGLITDMFAAPANYFGMYWGSPDGYNTITFTDVNGVQTSYVPGTGLLAGLTPNQTTAQYVNFFDTGAAWASISFTSSAAAFEFDNVATVAAPAATPEPASIALLASGLVVAGVLRRRKSA